MNNNYQALARKWRPSNFAEFVGQEHVTTTLVNSLNNQRMHHAYLFSGTRGVGKTTLARIIAKCISCEQGVSSEPCGNCNACISLKNNNYFDLIEVDAASKTKVEDTRELIDNMQFVPSAGKYRIYIIDEVHMLSKHSFNALLKTLEEPPEHVKFIFATTEVNKLPITILSRTIHFKLKAIPTNDIQAHLEKILTQENITFTPQAINTIATAAKGSVRDSLSLLEQCIAFCDQKITTEQVNEVLGVVEDEHLYQLLIAIINNNPIAAMDKISQLAELAIDFSKVAEAMLLLLHTITKAQLDISLISDNYQTATIIDLAKQITPEDLQLLYQIALLGKQDLAISPNLQTGFEMLVIRMMIFMPATQQAKKKEAKRITIDKTMPATNITAQQLNNATNNNDTKQLNWQHIHAQLSLSGLEKVISARCELRNKNNSYTLVLDNSQAPLLTDLVAKNICAQIQQQEPRLKNIQIIIGTQDSKLTPFAINEDNFQQKQHKDKLKILASSAAKTIINKLDAQLEEIEYNKD